MNKTLVMIVFVSFLVGCTTQVPDTELKNNLSINNTQKEPSVPDVTELQIDEIEVGTGDEAKVGDSVSVHYTGRLTNGTKFDSSVDRGTPFSFQLGAGEVIQGWDLGVAGMKVGGIRKLTIPSDLAYGPRSVGSIPANSTLVFEVELLEIQ